MTDEAASARLASHLTPSAVCAWHTDMQGEEGARLNDDSSDEEVDAAGRKQTAIEQSASDEHESLLMELMAFGEHEVYEEESRLFVSLTQREARPSCGG